MNVLKLKKVVEGILPRFLEGFLRETRQSESRQQFFGAKPEEIFRRTKILLETLKEKMMSYDANSLQAKKAHSVKKSSKIISNLKIFT